MTKQGPNNPQQVCDVSLVITTWTNAICYSFWEGSQYCGPYCFTVPFVLFVLRQRYGIWLTRWLVVGTWAASPRYGWSPLCSLFFVPQGSKKTNPQSNNNYQKRRPKLTENHEKVTPGGVPEARGGGLGTILVPRVARRRKRRENGLGDPPPRDPVGRPNLDFLSILRSCFFCFFWLSFWEVSGSNFEWFGGGFGRDFWIFCHEFCKIHEGRNIKNAILYWYVHFLLR